MGKLTRAIREAYPNLPAWALEAASAQRWREPDRDPGTLTRAERNLRWIERHCRIPEGKDVGKAVVLRVWQAAILFMIYDNPAGRTRRAIISFGKKNAKTSLSAFLLLLHLAGPEARRNTQLPSTAQSREQAATLFSLAAKAVRQSPTLEPFVTVLDHSKQLRCDELGTVYKALSAEDKTAHGQSPAFAVHDELGQVRGPVSKLYNAIENAMGAHDEPLSIVISTQAATDADLLSVLIDDALTGADPSTVAILFSAPENIDGRKIDPFSDEALRLANPAFGDFLNPEELRRQARDAKRMPSKEADFRNFVLNQRIAVRSPFVSRTVWRSNNAEPLPIEAWQELGLPVYAGLDLAEVNDLAALVMVAPYEERWHTLGRFWLPAVGLEDKAGRDKVPYPLWRDQGFLSTTPGHSIEFRFLAATLRGLSRQVDLRAVGFDRWKYRHLRPWLAQEGFSEDELEGDRAIFRPFGQGFQDMSPALDTLEIDLLAGRFAHGDNPLLNMCAFNAVVKRDEAGNRKLNKADSYGRIDGLVSLAMARAVAAVYEGGPELDIEAMCA